MSKKIDEGLVSSIIKLGGAALRSPAVRQTARTIGLGGALGAVWNKTQGGNPNPSTPTGSPNFSNMGNKGNAGYLPQRNNNPGNITVGGKGLQAKLGASGVMRSPNGRSYYTFDTPEAGFKAMHTLMSSSSYKDLPGEQALRRWVGPGYNDNYAKVFRQHGIDLSKPYTQQDPVKWARAKAQAEGYYSNKVNESNTKLSKMDVIDRAVNVYAPTTETPPSISEMFVASVERLSEGHAITLMKLFNDLSEDNQEVMLNLVQTDQGVRELLDFAIDKYMAQKN